MKRAMILLSILSISFGVFSQQTVGLFINEEDAFPGYTLFSTNSDNVYLIDNCGYEINSWEVESRGAGASYILENGELLKAVRINQSSFNAGGSQGAVEKYSWEGSLLWSIEYSSDQFHSHHDIFPMENGNVLIIAWEKKSNQEVESLGRTNIPNGGFWSETVVELRPIGNDDYEIVWKWDIIDHLVQDVDASLANYGEINDNPQLLDINVGLTLASDWIHFNAIDYNPELDQIILSSRSMNEIYIIDHSTTTQEAAGHTGGLSGKGGDILFRWGNPSNYKSGTAEDQQFYGQHNARWIKNNSATNGNITVFNNGGGTPMGSIFSTIIEIEPSLDGYNYRLENGTFLPNNSVWEYRSDPPEDFYSARVSSAQRMPNDNTFITQGGGGRLFEVDVDGNIVWEYINPIATTGPLSQGSTNGNIDLFKSMKYDVYDSRFQGKDLSPKGPIEEDPLDYECETSSVPAVEEGTFKYSNPVFEVLNLWAADHIINKVELYTVDGELVEKISISQTSESTQVDISKLKSGLYFLKTDSASFKLIKL